MTDKISVSIAVEAAPEVVYDMVSDVTRMGEWSPETERCRWLDGATGPRVGARFAGVNAHGGRRWRTQCRVTAADRGREFAFQVTGGRILPVAVWRYEFRPASGGGCEITERWEDRRGPFLRWYGRRWIRVPDRAAHNRRGMEETLRRIKAAAEESAR